MSISITVAKTVPEDAFARVVALTKLLQESDENFQGVDLQVQRGDLTAVALKVTDGDDAMRERLLWMLVADALKGEPDSVMGALC
jgi:hypothetical protein